MDNLIPKPYVGTELELASVPGPTTHFLGDLSHSPAPQFPSLQNIRNSTNLLPHVLHKPAAVKCCIQPRF